MKNYESYETPSERLKAYLNIFTQSLPYDSIIFLAAFAAWLDEETKEPSELKPCPFCGAAAFINQNDVGFSAQCSNCRVESLPQLTEESATLLWNQRALITQSPD